MGGGGGTAVDRDGRHEQGSDGKASGEEKADDLRKMVADAQAYYIDRDEANSDSMVKHMEGITGVWFGGGDQVLLTEALLGTRVEKAIHERYAAGAALSPPAPAQPIHQRGAGIPSAFGSWHR